MAHPFVKLYGGYRKEGFPEGTVWINLLDVHKVEEGPSYKRNYDRDPETGKYGRTETHHTCKLFIRGEGTGADSYDPGLFYINDCGVSDTIAMLETIHELYHPHIKDTKPETKET